MIPVYYPVHVLHVHRRTTGPILYRFFLRSYPKVFGKYVRFIYPDGGEEWIRRGNYHRMDGPARIHPGKAPEYYIEGRKYTEEEWKAKMFNKSLKKVFYSR